MGEEFISENFYLNVKRPRNILLFDEVLLEMPFLTLNPSKFFPAPVVISS